MNHTAYKSLKKLLLMSLVLFAGHAIGQTTQGTKVDGKQNAQQLVSPSKQGAGLAVSEKKEAKPNLTSTPNGNAAKPTRVDHRVAGTNKSSQTVTPGVPTKTGDAYTKPAPMSREAELKAYIADIDAKLPKVKGTAKEADLLSKRATFQAELDKIAATNSDNKKN